MRIPHVINQNTIQSYKLQPNTRKYETKLIKSHDFEWDKKLIPTLRETCLRAVAHNWEVLERHIFNEIKWQLDRESLIELLSANLTLKLTIPNINDEYFWERWYYNQWTNSPPPKRLIFMSSAISVPSSENSIELSKEDSELVDDSKSEQCDFVENDNNTNDSILNQSIDLETIDRYFDEHICAGVEAILPTQIIADEETLILKTWKQCALERYIQDELERLKPDLYNIESIKKLTDLCGHYIISLHLKNLQPSKTDDDHNCDHISLVTLITNLPNLLELSVCFNAGKIRENFAWRAMDVSDNDCDLLGKAVKKSKIKILRILQSNINCEKAPLIFRHLWQCVHLRVLDLSHCAISDQGSITLAQLIKRNRFIQILILVNNQIGTLGIKSLAVILSNPENNLKEINLRLNLLGPNGAKYLSYALVKGSKNLTTLNISACGLTKDNLHFGRALALNTTLQKLDLSCNHLGEEAAKAIITGLKTNTVLAHLDLRMCQISPRLLQEIDHMVRKNLKRSRDFLKTTHCSNDTA